MVINMETHCMKLIHILLCPAIISTGTVQLNGPTYIKRYSYMYINCSSNETPEFYTADFFINGRAYTSLQRYDNVCYSARQKCQLDCFCSENGKNYGLFILASIRTLEMTVSCTMRFEENGRTVSKHDSLIVEIHDPPFLKADYSVLCNVSSTVQITCYGNGNIGSFSEWIHSYSGKVIRTIPGKELNNTSTISFASCDFEDFGEYTCKAWNTIENQTYWSNVTTRLIVHGPPKLIWFNSTENHEKPRIFAVTFYSWHSPTFIHWTKDHTPVDNFTGLFVNVYEKNLTVNMYGKPMVNLGYETSLTVNERSSSVYSVVLKNEFGEYSHHFQHVKIQEEKEEYFSLSTVVWILICMAVFMLTVTIATILFSRRGRMYSKRFENTGNASIYYAAPSSVYNVSPYAATRLDNEEPLHFQHTLRRGNDEPEEDIETHHYIEILG